MTIRELYQWADKNNATDMDIGVQYMDSGGFYGGNTYLDSHDISPSIEKSTCGKYVLLDIE